MPPKGKTAARLSHVMVPEGGHREEEGGTLRTSVPQTIFLRAGGSGEGMGRG